MLVLLIVAILVVAALASVAYIILSSGGNPQGPPAVKLDHVNITGGAAVDQSGYLTLSATAVDTKGTDRTSSATWRWSASPAASVSFVSSTSLATTQLRAKQAGGVTITANASWNNSAKETSHSVTVAALTYELTPASAFPLVGTSFAVALRVLRGTTVATSYNGTAQFSSDDPGATLAAPYNFTAVDAGQAIRPGFAISKSGAVTLTATDTFAPITGSGTVNGNRAPVASITITPNSVDPRKMTADGSASSDPDGDAITFLWDLGDGGSATTAIVAHTYATAGPYNVRLTVTDSHSVSNTTNQTYHAKAPPTANFRVTGQSPAGPAIRVDVDGSASFDPDGSVVNYNWTWGDGNYSSVSTPTTFHNYGSFWINKQVTIVLRVTDNDNLNNATAETIQVTIVPQPPVARFSITRIDQINRTVYVDAGASSDPNGNIFSYNWSWGDGRWTNLTATTASHMYQADGNFVVNLTVVDTTNLRGWAEKPVSILQPPVAPIAVFTATRNLMHVDADASASFDSNGNLASYTFNWGDGVTTGPQTSPLASHTYASAGKYAITLTVTDTTSLQGTATHTVSVATSTIDYNFHDFFNVPYGEWWDFRYSLYGDLPIHADCFNKTSTTDRIGANKPVCTPSATNNNPDWETYPYTNWYPLPGQIRPGNPTNNPVVYAPYLFDVKGVNVPGYNRSEPVFLPVFNYAAPAGNQLDFHWYLQYFDVATANAVTARGCPGVAPTSNDGFQVRSQIWLTMDLAESKRLFGVVATTPAQAASWWTTNTNNACATQGPLETAVSNWFLNLGGPSGYEGKYDIVNSFQYAYTPFYTNITATVDPTTGQTKVYIEHAAWGTEVLLARMFYWGNASYIANYLDSTKARGWWGMELAWFENMNFQGSLGPPGGGFDFTLSSAMQYHYQQLTFPNTGGFDRKDDVPYWSWGPILSDYTNDYTPKHLISELDRYPSPYYGYIHSTPGSARYGQNLTYDYPPIKWDLAAGQTWHFQYPTGNVVFYDPNNTPLGSDPRYGAYIPINKTLSYDSQKPAGFGTWNTKNMTWDVYGPAITGGPVGNAGPDGTPGTTDDKYALDPWGTLNLVPGVAALISSSPVLSSSPVVSSGGSFQALPTGFTDTSIVAIIPARMTARSRE